MLWAPLLPFASIRTPTSRNDPEAALLGDANNVISILELVVFKTGFETLANTPVAPSIRIGSLVGIEGAAVNVDGDEVIGPGYVILRVVVVSGELAIKEPDTRIPAPDTPGLAVCALLFV